MNDNTVTSEGGCLCGGVRYRVLRPLRDVIACHCSQCRRTSGHFVAATRAALTDFVLVKSDSLTWYASSPTAERGFCSRCGGNLFWRPKTPGHASISIMAGTVDVPTHLKMVQHIFVADKSDYYGISDGAEQFAQWPSEN